MESRETDDENKLANSSRNPTLEGKRIIIMVADLLLGGSERQALLLSQYLSSEHGARVEFWGLGSAVGVVAQRCEQNGIPWRRISASEWFLGRVGKLRVLVKVFAALRKAQPDVILSYLILPNVVCGLIWRWTGARVCIWNQRDAGLERFGTRTEQVALRLSRCFVSNSLGGADFLTAELGVPPERVHVIHNAIRLAPARIDRASWRSDLGISGDTFTACMVANVSRYKDHETLLRAWRRVIDELATQGRSGMLLLAGRSGTTTTELKALAFDLNLSGSVRFLDYVDDIPGVLGASDLGILSSISESSPNAALEAMAAGLPVVGTDNSGMREALGPEGHEFLAPPGDVEGLANQILRFANDESLRERVGNINRLQIEREFNPSVTCAQMVALIVKGLQQTTHP